MIIHRTIRTDTETSCLSNCINIYCTAATEKIKQKFGWDIPQKVEQLTIEKLVEILHIHPDDYEKFYRIYTNLGYTVVDRLDDRIVVLKQPSE